MTFFQTGQIILLSKSKNNLAVTPAHTIVLAPSPSDHSSPPNSPFSHIKHSYTIPKTPVSPARFNTFHHRSSLCTKHHSILCTVCCVSAPHPEVLYQPPGVEAFPPASQAQTHSPPSPALAERTDDQSPTVESTPLLLTNRSPHSRAPVAHSAFTYNSHKRSSKCQYMFT